MLSFLCRMMYNIHVSNEPCAGCQGQPRAVLAQKRGCPGQPGWGEAREPPEFSGPQDGVWGQWPQIGFYCTVRRNRSKPSRPSSVHL